jgi:hypothetical protein
MAAGIIFLLPRSVSWISAVWNFYTSNKDATAPR